MNLKKLLLLTSIEVLFFVIIIASLLFVRHQSWVYLTDIQAYSPQIAQLQYDLQANNLTATNSVALDQALNDVSSITNKSLLLTNYIFPAWFILLFVLFQLTYWHFASQKKYIKVIILTAIQAFLMLAFAYLFLDALSYLLYGEESLNLALFIIVLVLLTIITLFNIIYFSTSKPIKSCFKGLLKHKFLLTFNFAIVLAVLAFQLLLAILIYVFVESNISMLAPSVLLLVVSIFANMHRIYLIDKIKNS